MSRGLRWLLTDSAGVFAGLEGERAGGIAVGVDDGEEESAGAAGYALDEGSWAGQVRRVTGARDLRL
jgi:hypothetical protein